MSSLNPLFPPPSFVLIRFTRVLLADFNAAVAPLQDSVTYRAVDGGREPLLVASLFNCARTHTHERAQGLAMSSSAVHASVQYDTKKYQKEFNAVAAVVPPSRTFILNVSINRIE